MAVSHLHGLHTIAHPLSSLQLTHPLWLLNRISICQGLLCPPSSPKTVISPEIATFSIPHALGAVILRFFFHFRSFSFFPLFSPFQSFSLPLLRPSFLLPVLSF